MMRFMTFAIGLGLVILAEHNMQADGLSQQEMILLSVMLAFIALGVLVEAVCGAYDKRQGSIVAVEQARAEAAQAWPVDPPEVALTTDPAGAASVPPPAASAPTPPGEVHTLSRRWAVRPDQQLPPGDDLIDPEGKAADRG